MTGLIRAAYRRARRTGDTVYAWPTLFYRHALSDTIPDAGSCGGTFLAVTPSGRVERYTYDPTVRLPDGKYGRWSVTARAIVDARGTVISAEEVQG